MRNRSIWILSLVICHWSFIPISAQASNKNVGTSGAQFLKIGAGARPTAMGDSFVGIADDINAVYYNPAGLANLSHPELTAMHTQWFQGINYDFGAFVLPSEYGAFAVSVATLKVDDHIKRGADESNEGTFEALDAAYGLSYARSLYSNLSLGLTARYIHQEIDTAKASTWSGDVGLLKRFEEKPLTVGLAIRHLGQNVRFSEESDPLPTEIDLGVGSAVLRDRLKLGFDIKRPRDNDLQFGTGAEWKQALRGDFKYAVRGGYNSSGTDADGTTGISLGAGLGFRQFDFDFAWVPFGILGHTFRYSASLRF